MTEANLNEPKRGNEEETVNSNVRNDDFGNNKSQVNFYYSAAFIVLLLLFSTKNVLRLIVLSIVGFIVWIFLGSYVLITPKQRGPSIRSRFPRFHFTRSHVWNKKLKELSQDETFDSQRYESQFTQRTENIANLVVRDFVKSWYSSISSSNKFPNEIKYLIQDAFLRLESRASTINVPKLLILDILPKVTKHFDTFIIAEENIVGHNDVTGSSELDLKIAREFETVNKLHRNIVQAKFDLPDSINNYARTIATVLINKLLPESELSSSIVPPIVRELLTNVVLSPVLRILSDSDFWNQTIDKLASAALKDRDQVRELRHAIDEQYNKPTKLSNSTHTNLLETKITPQMKQHEFEKYIKEIDKLNSIPILKQLRYYIAVQISKTQKITSTSEKYLNFCKRLEVAKHSIDKRLSQALIDKQEGDVKRNSIVHQNFSLEDFITKLSLAQILSNPSALSYFVEFMEERSRTVLLQYWLTVNGIKDPLEDPQNPDYEEELSSSASLSGVDDITNIFKQYFSQKLLKIDEDVYKEVQDFSLGKERSIEKYLRVRKLILVLQSETFKRMEKRDLPDFKNSDLFLKLLASETFEESLSSSVDIQNDEINDKEESENPDWKNPDQSLTEIEDALNTILTKKDRIETLKFDSGSSDVSTKKSSSSEKLRSEIFGSEEKGFLDEKPLFEDSDLEDTEELEEDEDIDDNLAADPEFFSSTHDVLNLKDEISRLQDDIEKLTTQSEILDPLILKAELTHNTSELRLLKKSKASYQREIEAKDLKRQQLIVQENDSSLYGKTSIDINSWVKGHSDGRDYIVYVIQVEKTSTQEDQDGTTWVVGRRFNQFHKLNEILKRDCPEVNSIPFPKKKIMLKFQQKYLIDERRSQLQSYLRALLEMHTVCQHKEFRKFLTVEDYRIPASSLPQRLSTSNFEIKDAASRLYNGLYSGIDLFSSRNTSTENLKVTNSVEESSQNSQPDHNDVEDMRKELETFEIQREKILNRGSFVKPITDLFISLFPLNKRNSWLRGRAIIVVLQQLFGSTIEKHIKGQILNLVTQDKVQEMIGILENILWPNGEFMKSGVPRTAKEKIQSKQRARVLLESLMIDSFSKLVGQSGTKIATTRIHSMLQNDILNANLTFELFDTIIVALYPELSLN